MAAKTIDIVVFGATGFTGSRVAGYLVKQLATETFTLALCGRNAAKLESVRDKLCSDHGISKERLPLFVTDATHTDSLEKVTAQARVLLNCVGPFRFTGEDVVRACIKGKCDYLDISGEPQFIENSMLKYHEDAKAVGVLVTHACGFDSMPADLGVRFCVDEAKKRCIELACVEGFMKIFAPKHFVGNFTTWESMVHGVSAPDELRGSRSGLRKKRWPAKVERVASGLKVHKLPFISKHTNDWSMLFPGADAAIVRSTQKSLAANGWSSPLPWYHAYFSFRKVDGIVKALGLAAVFLPLSKLKKGRELLLKYPEIFSGAVVSKKGPTQTQIDQTSFQIEFRCFTSKAAGENDPAFVCKMTGPEPGYVATPIFMAESALYLLKNKQSITPNAGVYTPGVVFYHDSLLKRFYERGIRFESGVSMSGKRRS